MAQFSILYWRHRPRHIREVEVCFPLPNFLPCPRCALPVGFDSPIGRWGMTRLVGHTHSTHGLSVLSTDCFLWYVCWGCIHCWCCSLSFTHWAHQSSREPSLCSQNKGCILLHSLLFIMVLNQWLLNFSLTSHLVRTSHHWCPGILQGMSVVGGILTAFHLLISVKGIMGLKNLEDTP